MLRWLSYCLDFLPMALGLWVFISPWVLGFSHQSRAAWDDWVTGALVFLLALSAWRTTASQRRGNPETPPTRPNKAIPTGI